MRSPPPSLLLRPPSCGASAFGMGKRADVLATSRSFKGVGGGGGGRGIHLSIHLSAWGETLSWDAEMRHPSVLWRRWNGRECAAMIMLMPMLLLLFVQWLWSRNGDWHGLPISHFAFQCAVPPCTALPLLLGFHGDGPQTDERTNERSDESGRTDGLTSSSSSWWICFVI